MIQRVYFEEPKGKNIFTVFSEPPNPQKKLVIMCHGFRGSSLGPARQFVDFQQVLNQEGISTLRFDQPNSGNSEGEFINSSFNEWVNTIVYFAKKYLDQGYQVSLLGQSMGATASVIASSHPSLKEKLPCLLLWVPDPKSTVDLNSNNIYEEAGQRYKGSFWDEAKKSDFFKCLDEYNGKIHLVYGEDDRYVDRELREKVIQIVKEKGQEVMILKGQDHSPWEHTLVQAVFKNELLMLKLKGNSS